MAPWNHLLSLSLQKRFPPPQIKYWIIAQTWKTTYVMYYSTKSISSSWTSTSKKPFDMTSRGKIIQILKEIGINGNLIFFIANFLKKNIFQVKFQNVYSPWTATDYGLPQGLVLSATQYLIGINELTTIIPHSINI